jgi:hypothetical protein
MKSRGAAVIAAFVLIALAVFIRGKVVGGDGDGGSDGPKRSDDEAPVVACTPDLIEVCDALAEAGRISSPAPELDLDGASAPDTEIDGWITWNPAPAIANFDAGDPAVWGTPTVFGAALEAVLVDATTDGEIQAGCRTDPTWSCLAELSPGLTFGVGDPATAEGIARLAPFAQAFSEDDDYATLDTARLRELVDGPDAQASAVTMARQMAQPGFVSMTAGPADLLEQQAATPQGTQRGLRVLAPDPVNGLTVVLAPRAGREDDLDGLGCSDGGELPEGAAPALADLGVAPCTGRTTDALAGFLFQVQKKVG